MHSRRAHTANVLGAMVDLLARDLEAAMSLSAEGPGGRAAALTALAAFASGHPIDLLAHSLGLSHSRTVRVVDQLEVDGYVTRSRGTADRRTVAVTLTEAGWERAREVAGTRLAVLTAEVDALDADDRAALDRIAGKLLGRRIDGMRSAARTCRMCEPEACGHPGHCPVTLAADAFR
jgi:DNA-binding MarR family transcriptional regulator